jgi:hypothetical protein
VLAASGAVLALALASVVIGLTEPASVSATPEQGYGQCSKAVHGAAHALGSTAPRSCMQPRSAVLFERDALVGAAPSTVLPQQVLAARGRARFQADTQAVIRLIRERQDAIITAFSHRMRDASVPGAASHTADRPLIVTRPLRGPPARS